MGSTMISSHARARSFGGNNFISLNMETQENKPRKRRRRIGAIGSSKIVKEIEKLDKQIPDGTDPTKERK